MPRTTTAAIIVLTLLVLPATAQGATLEIDPEGTQETRTTVHNIGPVTNATLWAELAPQEESLRLEVGYGANLTSGDHHGSRLVLHLPPTGAP